MIDPKELRIGNFVCFSNEGTVFIVNEIHKTGLGVHDEIEDTWIEYDQFSPITITPEWLERFGFEKDRSGWFIMLNDFSLTDKYYPCWMNKMLWPQDLDKFKSMELKYIHQLQNLYHALTGQELTAKEKQDVR